MIAMDGTVEINSREIARGSRRAALIAIAGFVMTSAVIGSSIIEIGRLQNAENAYQSKIRVNAGRLSILDGKIEEKKREYAQAQDQLSKVALLLATGQQKAAAATLAQTSPTRDSAVVGRVYFQLRSEDQRPSFEACASELLAAGYRVPPAELISDRGPKLASLRYFRPTDGDEAGRLASMLDRCLGILVKVSMFTGKVDFDLVKPRQFEVWLPPVTPNDTQHN